VHGRTAFLGEQQVVPVERVLRAVPAADHAPATAHAAVEVHGDGRALERVLGAHAPRYLANDVLGRRLERNLRGAEHLPRALVVRGELGTPVRNIRPLFVVVEGVERLVEGVRVDERAAAHSRAGEDDEIVEQGQPLNSPQAEPRHEEVAAEVPVRSREVFRSESPAGLEHGDAIALLREAQRSDASAEAAPHDDDVHGVYRHGVEDTPVPCAV
jgi:hypothetical protein